MTTPDLPDLPTPPDGKPAALAAAEEPVPLRVQLVADDRTPEGMLCMGTFRDERLIARSVIPPEAWAQVTEHRLFQEPVPVVLVAREAAPGLQCQLFALLSLPPELLEDDEDEEDDEPWAESVPGASYERAAADAELDEDEELDDDDLDDDEEDDDEDEHVFAFPLGNIVRFEKDRVHPESLALEAADVLRRLIEGRTFEVVDKALEDLLGGNAP
ncbi:MAG TPA: hypothetical protein VFX50_04300 [Gemmatimonadales bacterium]|nr:hypothetical protein [Gemmatimonadales bacterium]